MSPDRLLALSLAPILLILFLMVGLRWGSARAGAAGYLCALAVSVAFFGAGPELLAYAHAKALLLSIDVLLIIWAAFLLYRVADEAGAIRTIGQALPHLTSDRAVQALLIAWVFASFLQGVGGFGVPVAVTAPILVALGFAPLAAVLMASVGHAWGVTFGSMGSAFQALLATTGQPASLLAPPSALFLGLAGLAGGYMVAHIAGGWSAVRRLALLILFLGGVMGGVQYLAATTGPWNLAAFLGGLAGLLVGVPLVYRSRDRNRQTDGPLDYRSLLVALSGYAILIVITLSALLIPALKSWLSQVVLQVDFPQVSTALGYVTPAGPGRRLNLFGHTGVLLFYSSLLAYLVYRSAGLYQAGATRRILDGTLQRVLPTSVSILSLVSMAVIMVHAGMTEALARGLASSFGAFFPFISPWIGAIGAFMTGSNTNSNVVFASLQLRAAQLLGQPEAIILAAQTAGAALASVVAPSKVVVGTSTASMAGHEGVVMRHLLVYIALLVFFVSIMAVLGVYLSHP